MLVCLGYYLTRIVWAGAYVGPHSENKTSVYLVVGILAALTTVLALIRKTNLFKDSLNLSDGGFLRLFLFFMVFFAIIILSRQISKRKNNQGND